VTDQQGGDDWFLVGIVTAPFGVRGEVRVEVITEFPARFRRKQTFYVGPEKTPVRLERAHGRGKGGLALKLEGYDTPEQAETLRRAHLYVPRSEAVPLPEGRYYVDEVIGLQARLISGRVLGQVVEVLTLPGNDVYVIDAGEHGQVLVPASRNVIKELNVAGRFMVIEPLPGLLPEGLA
jgi:16S rRNA processing protein RimM